MSLTISSWDGFSLTALWSLDEVMSLMIDMAYSAQWGDKIGFDGAFFA